MQVTAQPNFISQPDLVLWLSEVLVLQGATDTEFDISIGALLIWLALAIDKSGTMTKARTVKEPNSIFTSN